MTTREISDVVIARSDSDEAIHVIRAARTTGLLRCARNDTLFQHSDRLRDTNDTKTASTTMTRIRPTANISGTIIIAMPNHQMTTLNKRLTQQIPRDR